MVQGNFDAVGTQAAVLAGFAVLWREVSISLQDSLMV